MESMVVRQGQFPSPEAPPPDLYSRRPDPVAVAAVLDEWMRGDAEEQRETFELLKASLDDGRPEGYKLFP
jgi:hypothetical protein